MKKIFELCEGTADMCCVRELIGTYQNVPGDWTCHLDDVCAEGGRSSWMGLSTFFVMYNNETLVCW